MLRLGLATTLLVAATTFVGCSSNSSSPRITVERVQEHLSRELPALAFERTTVTIAGRDMDSLAGDFEGSAKLLIIGADDMRDSMDLATARGEVAAILVNTPFSADKAAAAARVQQIATPVADLYGSEVAGWTAYAIDLARREPHGIHVRSFGGDMKVRVTWGGDAGQLTFSIETPSYPFYWNDPPSE
jgi:hypothetical protein